MKACITFSIFLFIFVFPSRAQWHFEQLGQPNLRSIQFIDEYTGYIGGIGKLYKTTDSGLSWLTINDLTNDEIVCISFLDNNTGIVGGGEIYREGFLYITTDGGESWSSERNLSRFISDVQIVNNQTAYAIDELGNLYKTIDLNTWSLRNSFPSRCYSMHFESENLGWVVGNNSTLYKTKNGGIDWKAVQLGSNLALFDVFFLDDSVGWVISHEGYLFKTVDGGSHWDTLNTGYTETNHIMFVNENKGFISGANKMLKTTDGGITWSIKTLLNLGNFWNNNLFFTNENSGFSIGESGTIYHTSDGGNNWLIQQLNEFNDLYSVKVRSGTDAICVGENGTILKTTNLGRNWISLVSPVYQNLNSIILLPGVIYIAVGDSGTIIKSFDVRHWESINSPTVTDLNDLYFFDYLNGILIGDAGKIFKTSDAGANWQNISTGVTNNLKKIDFVNDTIGYIVGDDALLLKTTSGGNSWYITNQINRDNLFDVQFTNSSIGYISSDYGVVYKTDDAGENWFPLYTHYSSENITAIHFITQYFGWVATDNKRIFRTSDGGISWSSRINLPIRINSFDFYDSNHGIAVGENGSIMIGDGGHPIPVELISFIGYQKQGRVHLEWQTATELNNLLFEIQRNVDSTEWVSIGYKQGAGTTSNLQEYIFIDDCLGIKGGSTLFYRLKQTDFNGDYKLSNIVSIPNFALSNFEISQNYPNPFNPATTITYQIPERGFVTLKVYDVLGNEVATLVNEEKPAGSYQVEFDGSNLSSGIYFYQLRENNFVEIKKMVFIK